MDGYLDPKGMSHSAGVTASVRSHGQAFALELVRCHARFLAGQADQRDPLGRCYYSTSAGTVVFIMPSKAPWHAFVCLPQEL
jgi:hypothetical protein